MGSRGVWRHFFGEIGGKLKLGIILGEKEAGKGSFGVTWAHFWGVPNFWGQFWGVIGVKRGSSAHFWGRSEGKWEFGCFGG